MKTEVWNISHTDYVFNFFACICLFGYLCRCKFHYQQLDKKWGNTAPRLHQWPSKQEYNSKADLMSCMAMHAWQPGNKEERASAWKRKSESVRNFVTEGSFECTFSLHFSIWLDWHKSAGLRLNNRCLLDTPPVVKRGSAKYFTQFYCVEIYCLNLAHCKGTLIRVWQ